MAEYVEQNLEGLVGVFEQLERTELFKHEEVKKIIGHVRKHEYKLQRRVKCSSDYTTYARYLRSCAALIRKRRQRLDYWLKKKEIDSALNKKTDSVYALVCERFQSEKALWLERIEFLSQIKADHRVSKCYARFLQIHNDKEDVWLAAVRWEMTSNRDFEASRSLLHQALRFHKTSIALWSELFAVELKFVEFLLQRRKCLEKAESTTDSAMDVTETTADDVLQMKLTGVVLKQALQAADHDNVAHRFGILSSFYPLARHYEFSASIADDIREQLEHDDDLNTHEPVWMWRIDQLKRELLGEDEVMVDGASMVTVDNRVLSMYSTAASACATRSCYRAYIDFCKQLVQDTKGDADRRHVHAVQHLFKLVNQHPEYVEPTDLMLLCQCYDDPAEPLAINKTIDKMLGIYSSQPAFWCIKIQSVIDADADPKVIKKLFNKAMKATSSNKSDDCCLWRLAFKWTSEHQSRSNLEALVQSASILSVSVASEMKWTWTRWLISQHDVTSDQVHDEYMKLARQQPNAATLYTNYIQHLSSQIDDDVKPVVSRLCEVYELWLADCGTECVDVWLEYMQLLNKYSPTKVSAVYQRALGRIDKQHVDIFINQFAMIRHAQS